jgi:hypothetical protein
MQLQVLRDRLEVVAERDIPDPAILLAAAEVIREIEAYDYRLVERSFATTPLVSGVNTYDLAVLNAAINRQSLLDIWLEPARGRPRRLLPQDEMAIQQLAPTIAPYLYYYTFDSNSLIRLNTIPTEGGNLRVYWRTYDTDNLTLTTDVAYPPLLAGVLSWFGRTIWEDSSKEVFQANYAKQLKDYAARFQLRGSPLGNVLDRQQPAQHRYPDYRST